MTFGVVLKSAMIAGIILNLAACEPANQPDTALINADKMYSMWPTAERFNPYDLGTKLQASPQLANEICRTDQNRPAGFSTHIAAISTHYWDRKDLIVLYQLDPNKPVYLGATGKILAENLGAALRQEGQVNTKDQVVGEEVSADKIRITFSEGGKFTGYCDSTSGYTTIYRAPGEPGSDGQMREFSLDCSYPAALVCLSIR